MAAFLHESKPIGRWREEETLFKNVYTSPDYKNDIIIADSLEIYRNK